jgi:hypothetical protein
VDPRWGGRRAEWIRHKIAPRAKDEEIAGGFVEWCKTTSKAHPEAQPAGENPVERLCRRALFPDRQDRVLSIEAHGPTYPQRMAVMVPFWGGCPQGFPQGH